VPFREERQRLNQALADARASLEESGRAHERAEKDVHTAAERLKEATVRESRAASALQAYDEAVNFLEQLPPAPEDD
jgi:hypothetical protein